MERRYWILLIILTDQNVVQNQKLKPDDPEYMILEPVVSEEMAEVGLCLELRKPKSAEDVAAFVW